MDRLLRGARPYLLLGILCLGFALPGIATLPPLDRDESRFVQASRQMLESGDVIDIRFLDEPRNKKPAGIYWLQAASVAIFSDAESTAIWPYRVPSVLGAVAAVLLTFWGGTVLLGRRAAFAGAALLCGSLLFVVEAHIAKTDAMLLATVVLSHAALAHIFMRVKDGWSAHPGLAAAFWVGIGLGALLKGPIVPLVAALTIAVLKLARRGVPLLGALRPGWGVPLAAAIFAPWYLASMFWTDSDFVADAVSQDLLPKLLGGVESHGFPPGYFLLLMPILFWPGSLFVWPALVWAWGRRAAPGVLFCLAWLIPFWLVVELVPTKLPHYALPVYPALALLTGAALAAAAQGEWVAPLRAWWARGTYAGWAAIAFGIAALPAALPIIMGGSFTAWSALGIAVGVAVAIVGVTRAWRGQPAIALAAAVIGALPLYGSIYQGVLPALDALWLSRGAHALVATHSPHGELRPVVAGGYREPSLVFMLGSDTALPEPHELVDAFAERPEALALMGLDTVDVFVEESGARGIELRALGAVSGLNYSKGKRETLTLFERVP